LLQLRSPVSRSALVSLPPSDFGPHHFIRFENHNEGPSYRVHQGARKDGLCLWGCLWTFVMISVLGRQ
jgi:hypothetical protein